MFVAAGALLFTLQQELEVLQQGAAGLAVQVTQELYGGASKLSHSQVVAAFEGTRLHGALVSAVEAQAAWRWPSALLQLLLPTLAEYRTFDPVTLEFWPATDTASLSPSGFLDLFQSKLLHEDWSTDATACGTLSPLFRALDGCAKLVMRGVSPSAAVASAVASLADDSSAPECDASIAYLLGEMQSSYSRQLPHAVNALFALLDGNDDVAVDVQEYGDFVAVVWGDGDGDGDATGAAGVVKRRVRSALAVMEREEFGPPALEELTAQELVSGLEGAASLLRLYADVHIGALTDAAEDFLVNSLVAGALAVADADSDGALVPEEFGMLLRTLLGTLKAA